MRQFKVQWLLRFLVISTFSAASWASPQPPLNVNLGQTSQKRELCPQALEVTKGHMTSLWTCDASGYIMSKKRTHAEKGPISLEEFDHGLLISRKIWRQQTLQAQEERAFDFQKKTILISRYKFIEGQKTLAKKMVVADSQGGSLSSAHKVLKEWKFDEEGRLNAILEYAYGFEALTSKEIYDDNEKIQSRSTFVYSKKNLEALRGGQLTYPDAFEEHDGQGDLVAEYNYLQSPAPPALPSQDFIPVGMLDSGIDPFHSSLKDKLDWRDDSFGLGVAHPLGLPIEPIVPSKGPTRPSSHGLHVASLMLEGHDDVRLTTFGLIPPANFEASKSNGEWVRKVFKKSSDEIKKRGILFVNASLGHIPDFNGPPPIVNQKIENYRIFEQSIADLITQNPKTLFICAAGNGIPMVGGANVDDKDLWQFTVGAFPPTPASLDAENILVVGALTSHELDESQMHTYELTAFTNYGSTSVDLFAPGLDVPGAQLGGGQRNMSGTSMASPIAVNLGVLKVYKANPSLSNAQIKEVLLKTAYIKDIENPLPATSGGILYPTRAVAVADYLAAHPDESIEKAALLVRRQIFHIGEEGTSAYLKKVEAFWRSSSI